MISNFDITEKALAKRMTVIEVRGKSTRGLRKLFIILSEIMLKGCLHLLKTRLSIGIPVSNQFLFSRVESDTPLDGCEAMRVMSELCEGLEKPGLIRTRLLRKHLATTVQVLYMREDELKIVADHLGHSVSIHTDVYRLQSSWLEKTKVARVSENGMMRKCSGRSLNSLNLEEIPVIDEDELALNEKSEDIEQTYDLSENSISESEENRPTKRRNDVLNSNTESEENRPSKRRKTSRKRWTSE